MMDGVAEWEYVEDGKPKSDVEDGEEAANSPSPSPVASLSPNSSRKSRAKPKTQEKLELVDNEEIEDESSPVAQPTPRSNGKKFAAVPAPTPRPTARASRAAKKPLRESIAKSSPLNRSSPATTTKSKPTPTRITKAPLKPKSPLVRANAKLPITVAALKKEEVAAKAKAGKGKGKRKGRKMCRRRMFLIWMSRNKTADVDDHVIIYFLACISATSC